MTKDEFCNLMKDIENLPLSSVIGGGYSYNKSLIFGVLNNHQCYSIMSDISNKEMTHGSPWSSIEQDELLHSIENITGFNTYYYSRKSYNDCILMAKSSFNALGNKGILDYGDKMNPDRIIKQIAFGISINTEKTWHSPDSWAPYSWYIKVPLFDDEHICGDNLYFERNGQQPMTEVTGLL